MNTPAEKQAPEQPTPPEGPTDETRKAEAMRRGWRPEDEYSGPEGTWRDFDEFLKVGDEIDLHRQNKRLKADIDALQMTVDKFQPFMEKSIANAKAERDKAIADLEALKAQAISDADGPAVVQADRKIAQLREEQAEPPETAQKPLTPAQNAFVARNQDWFQVDPKMTAYADQLGDEIMRTNPTLGEREYFQLLETGVRSEFAPSGPAAAAVSTPSPPARTKKHSYANLPDADKAACDEFVETIPGFTREQYCSTYEWDD